MRVLHTLGNCSDIKLGVVSLGRGVRPLIVCDGLEYREGTNKLRLGLLLHVLELRECFLTGP